MSCVPEFPTCPCCETALAHCAGNPEMPASQEFWRCRRCGLNAHISRFVTAESRAELEREHSEALRQRIDDGRMAQGLLNTGRKAWAENRAFTPLLILGFGVLAGVVVNRLFKKR